MSGDQRTDQSSRTDHYIVDADNLIQCTMVPDALLARTIAALRETATAAHYSGVLPRHGLRKQVNAERVELKAQPFTACADPACAEARAVFTELEGLR